VSSRQFKGRNVFGRLASLAEDISRLDLAKLTKRKAAGLRKAGGLSENHPGSATSE
jgi:hypothetical protein